VPSVVGRAGVLRVLPVPLSPEEHDGLHRSARAVRTVIDRLAAVHTTAAVQTIAAPTTAAIQTIAAPTI